jgi:5-methylcytosine-specific restriction endonuclease McrA
VNEHKTCGKCCQVLLPEDFYKEAQGAGGLRANCKACESARSRTYRLANKEPITAIKRAYSLAHKKVINTRNRAYRLKNRERLNAFNRAYRKTHTEGQSKSKLKRRAQKLGNGIFLVTTKELKRIKNSPCTFCNSTKNIHIDHISPLSKGGRHSIGNLQALCQSCNTSKGASFYSVFRYRSRSEL